MADTTPNGTAAPNTDIEMKEEAPAEVSYMRLPTLSHHPPTNPR